MTVMSDDNPIMPIGKYKGRGRRGDGDRSEIYRMAAAATLVRPTTQDDLQLHRPGGPPSDMSPEHNTLQVRFLDDAFCEKVVRAVFDFSNTKEEMIKCEINDWASPEARRELQELIKTKKFRTAPLVLNITDRRWRKSATLPSPLL